MIILDNCYSTEKLRSVAPAEWEIVALSPQEFSEQISVLQKRRKLARTGKPLIESSLFDSAEVVFVDCSEDVGDYLPYLIRCYSTCGYIVAVNQFSLSRMFSLRHAPNLKYFADLHISSDDISSTGLWTQVFDGCYRPWSWVHIPTAAKKHKRRTNGLKNIMGMSISDYFGDSGRGYFGGLDGYLTELFAARELDPTFLDMVQTVKRPQDVIPLQFASHIASSRLHKWLQQDLLHRGSIFVDAPHLIYRFPSLIGNYSYDDLVRDGIGLVDLEDQQFQKKEWFTHPVWNWRSVTNRISEMYDMTTLLLSPDPVFCEDTSRFVARDNAHSFDKGSATFSFGYVEKLNGVQYQSPDRLF